VEDAGVASVEGYIGAVLGECCDDEKREDSPNPHRLELFEIIKPQPLPTRECAISTRPIIM
jgi:hypothetical protein